MKTVHIVAMIVVAIVVTAGISVVLLNNTGGKDDDPGVQVVDATGRTVTVKSYERIASASAETTAILCGLGLSSHIVGVSVDDGVYDEAPQIIGMPDDDFPKAITDGLENGGIISMGHMWNMAAESIVQKGIDPDLVIFGTGGFKQDTGDRLTELGITYVVLYGLSSVDTVYKNIGILGNITETSDKAAEMISNIDHVISKINAWSANIVSTELGNEKVRVAPMMTDTYAMGEGYIGGSYPLAISATNVFDEIAKYAEINKEALAEKNPDVIIYTNLEMGGIEDPAAYVAALKTDDILKNVDAVVNDKVFLTSGGAKNSMSVATQGIVYAYAMFSMFTYCDHLGFDIPTELDTDNYYDLCSQFWEEVNA